MKNITTTLKPIKNFLQQNIVNTIFILITLILFILGTTPNTSGPQLIIYDVGQGDAILIQQDNFQILIDGGPDDTIVYQLAKSMPWYDKTIEYAILTHPHEDHIRGLLNVLDQYEVLNILIHPIKYENRGYQHLLSTYQDIITNISQGDNISYKDISATVIYPFDEQKDQYKNINNESVVILLEIKGYRNLLMGDAEKEIEELIIQKYDLQNIYVLKVGHHCSRTSSSQMFLTMTNPDIAICSCSSNNKFGHPHYETLEKFQNMNVQYLITHKQGNIVINFNDL